MKEVEGALIGSPPRRRHSYDDYYLFTSLSENASAHQNYRSVASKTPYIRPLRVCESALCSTTLCSANSCGVSGQDCQHSPAGRVDTWILVWSDRDSLVESAWPNHLVFDTLVHAANAMLVREKGRYHGGRVHQESCFSLSISLLLQGMKGVRNPSATRAPPQLFDEALEECERAGLFSPGLRVIIFRLLCSLVLPGFTNC